ncbi:MAG: hypothetical protein C0506_10500 [Anaerolinea sp.]|nr:hypothetical protein [Anaerolinea sp.]
MLEPKRFIGNDLARIYQRVHRELGPEAMIVETRSLLREGAEPLIELLACLPEEDGLPLQLQGQMVRGVLGRVEHEPLPRTVGDLEDLAARESAHDAAMPPVELEYGLPEEPAWFQGFVSAAPAAPASRPPFAPLGSPPPEELAPLRFAPRPAPRGAAPRPFAVDQHPAPASFTPTPPASSAHLVAAGFSPAAALLVEPHEHGNSPEEALAGCLASLDLAYPDEQRSAVITIQGPAGSGRTTALMRMALDCAESGRSAVLVAADSSRIAGREQVRAYAEALGIPAVDAYSPQDLVHAVTGAPRGTCLFVDVPSGPWQSPPIPAAAHFAYLALPAHWQPGAIQSAIAAYPQGGLSGAVLTFTDLAPGLVPVLSALIERRLGIAFISSGRDVSTGIEVADLLTLASGTFTTPSGVTTNGRLVATA